MKPLIQLIILGIAVLLISFVFSTPNEIVVEVKQDRDKAVIKDKLYSEDYEKEPKTDLAEEEIIKQIKIIEEEAEIITEVSKNLSTSGQEIISDYFIPTKTEETKDKKEKPSQISFSKINEDIREALVNIFCTTKSGGTFKPITGSGIIIDDRGIILTNAHVAQYFLLKNYLTDDFIECKIRIGSPAVPTYEAIPIFISPSWIKENANEIIKESPKGTGENDYALLLITGSTNKQKSVPEIFPFVSPLYNSGSIVVGDQVLLAAYPAGFLSGISIAKDLYISSAITNIVEMFTFKDGSFDLFSIGGSIVAQQGSSGGAVVDRNSKLIGIIVTSSIEENTQDRDLHAITIAHINRSFMKDTGFDLQTLFSGDIEAEAQAFGENIAPELTQLLEDELNKSL